MGASENWSERRKPTKWGLGMEGRGLGRGKRIVERESKYAIGDQPRERK